MNLQNAQKTLAAYLDADIPAFLWGAPGIGKSDIVAGAARALGLPLIDLRATLLDPVDLRGLPMVADGAAKWARPDFLPFADRDGESGILFLDELNAAPASTQAACFQLVLNRRVGEYQLPEGWRIVAAGNRVSDRASASRMPSALANRFAHIDCEADLTAWSAWADSVNLSPLVVAFLRFRPELLHKMPEGEARAFPTPRAWAQVAKVAGAPDDIRLNLVSGLVGEGAAAEFEGFARVFKSLPSFAEIFLDPASARLPADNAGRYAVASGLSRAVTDGDKFQRALTYIRRIESREFEVLLATAIIRRDASLAETPAFVDWAIRNKDVTL